MFSKGQLLTPLLEEKEVKRKLDMIVDMPYIAKYYVV